MIRLLQELGHEVVESDTGQEHVAYTGEYDCVFVLEDFKGETFDTLHKADVRIVGAPVILLCAKEKQVSVFLRDGV